MQLAGVNAEPDNRPEHDACEQTGPVGIEERLECPPDPVVVEDREVACAEPEQARVVTSGPLVQTIEGLTSSTRFAIAGASFRRASSSGKVSASSAGSPSRSRTRFTIGSPPRVRDKSPSSSSLSSPAAL